MRWQRTLAMVLMLSAAACAEAANPMLAPSARGAHGAHAAVSTQYPAYNSEAEIPAAYSFAEIQRLSPIVYWEGGYANASSAMDYYGNSGVQQLKLTIFKGSTTVTTIGGDKSDEHFWPDYYHTVISGIGFQAPSTCGHVAQLDVSGIAKIVLLVAIKGVTVPSEVRDFRTNSRAQPACPSSSCPSTVSNDQTAYGGDFDPYAPSPAGCDGGSGNGTTGGTQYEVGDYTGGQTVDWKTGVGTGKLSACGDQARVDYICVEYNTGDGWKSLDCGYVTTC